MDAASAQKVVNKSPTFDTNDGWSGGYAIATAAGDGAIVGPGSTNANVFAQPFETKPGEQFKITACASSVQPDQSLAAIQVNWGDKDNQYLGSVRATAEVGEQETGFTHIAVAPADAAWGTLYVVPGGRRSSRDIRRAIQLRPWHDFVGQ